MNQFLLYPIGVSDSCRNASRRLEQAGFTLVDHPSPDITHLLLDVPSFDANGLLQDGTELSRLLRMLPDHITIIGGNLDQSCVRNLQKMDLLTDPHYLAKNAAITADCALRVASRYLKTTFDDSSALILGWGRIGKCLAGLLSSIGCCVTVAARKDSDRAMLEAMGYEAVDFPEIPRMRRHYDILFNTVPQLPIHSDSIAHIYDTALDLASYPGMEGSDVIPARGLPGKYAPESSGKLIAETILRLIGEDHL